MKFILRVWLRITNTEYLGVHETMDGDEIHPPDCGATSLRMVILTTKNLATWTSQFCA